jgi:hypothetical protein
MFIILSTNHFSMLQTSFEFLLHWETWILFAIIAVPLAYGLRKFGLI